MLHVTLDYHAKHKTRISAITDTPHSVYTSTEQFIYQKAHLLIPHVTSCYHPLSTLNRVVNLQFFIHYQDWC